jgi:hypothetical protein
MSAPKEHPTENFQSKEPSSQSIWRIVRAERDFRSVLSRRKDNVFGQTNRWGPVLGLCEVPFPEKKHN